MGIDQGLSPGPGPTKLSQGKATKEAPTSNVASALASAATEGPG